MSCCKRKETPPVDCNDCKAFLASNRADNPFTSNYQTVNGDGTTTSAPSAPSVLENSLTATQTRDAITSAPSMFDSSLSTTPPTSNLSVCPPCRGGQGRCPPCPPCRKKPKFEPSPDVLFNDIGFPEDSLGVTPFPETPCLTLDQIEENDRYEDDVEVWFSKPPAPVLGCTDPTANNYNPEATQDDGTCAYDPNPSTGQYTSNSSIPSAPTSTEMINSMTAASQAVSSVTSQDPDGIGWIQPSVWTNATWDGIPIDPTAPPGGNLCAWLRPASGNPYAVRGLREKFYEVNPFADNTNPTPAEIDNWHLEVIRHFRNLFGINVPVNHNARLYLEARWSSERKHLEDWDSSYPPTGDYGDAYGPCWNPPGTAIDIAGGHCGDGFIPNESNRATYIAAAPYNNDFVTYPELSSYTAKYSQAVGLAGVNANIPWSIKLAFIIGNWICGEGLSGHPGPYVNPTTAREEFGSDWWYPGGQTVYYRGKWR